MLLLWVQPDGQFLDADEAACKSLGYTREELRDLWVWDLDHEFPRDRWLELWARLRQLRRMRFASSFYCHDGDRVEAEIQLQLVDSGCPEHGLVLIRPRGEPRRTERTLSESEAHLALALEVSNQALFELDLVTGIAILSEAHPAMLGREIPDLAVGTDVWQQWLHPDDREAALGLFDECVSGTRERIRADFRFLAAEGRSIWIRSVARVVSRDGLGRPLRMLGTHIDITEEKRAEHAHALTLRAVDRAVVGVYQFDSEGRLVYINEEACRSLGYTREELLGERVDRFDPYITSEQLAEIERAVRVKGALRFETRHRRKDGTSFPVEVVANPIELDGHLHKFAFARDISDRKEADEALKASEAFLDSIIVQSPIPILIFDTWGRIVRANQAGIALFGREDASEAFHRYNLFEDERMRADGQLEQVERVFRNGETLRFQSRYPLHTQPPTTLELDSTIFPLRNAAGEISHAVVYHLDITQRKAAEARLRYHLESEQALADISGWMIKSGWEDLDIRFDAMLERLGRLMCAERCFFFSLSADGLVAVNNHEWCAPGIQPQISDLQALRAADYEPFYARLRQGEIVIARAENSDYGLRFKPGLLESGPHSLICIPVMWGSTLRGFVGLDSLTGERSWFEHDLRFLRLLAEIIAHTIQRLEAKQALLEQTRTLGESESRYRAVFDNATDAIIVHDAKGQILSVNRAMLEMYGLEQEEALDYRIQDMWGPQHVESVVFGYWQKVLEGESLHVDLTAMRPKDGFCFPVEVMLRSIQFGDRRAILANVRDITERKRAEEALRQSEERFAKAFRSNPAAIMISTIDEGRIIDANERYLHLIGAEREEVLGRTTLDIGIWGDRAFRDDMIERLKEGDSFLDAETVIHSRSGASRDILWSAEIIQLGGESALLSLVHDMTEQKRTQKALRESEARLSAAVESIPFDFFIMDLDGRYVLQNSSSKARWGDVVGDSPETSRVRRVYGEGWETRQRRVLAGEVVDEELVLDGDEDARFFRNVLAPIRDRDVVRGIVELSMDISERKRTERELQRHREHLEELVVERTDALRRVMGQLVQSEKLAALGNLVAGVAHELNTPLGNARMLSSTLEDSLRELGDVLERGELRRAQLLDFLESGLEAVRLLDRNTVRAAELVTHFKEVAVDQTSVRRRVFSLRQTVEETLATMRPTLKRCEHGIELDIPADLTLDSYPGPLEQILTNLIGNSLTHGFEGIESGHIRIGARALDPGSVRLIYRDDGLGIPAEKRSRIFDPFFTTRLGQGGSGLGLYIVYNLVTGVLGGTIEVGDSEDGRGAVFRLDLPCRAPERSQGESESGSGE
ncbi:Periplasmic Sensor Signal Transduction Histidine Kinase [Imhoffiella purpurea]|uniref:histidine kinase n=2 Tax=Imhoffiella purpurea TaxID=1249627 RepID=W9VJD5_9GAMM|nr:Periplasmic Sensor Signal Transduction Histidine Kinase [Imhoffiella purpurea]